MGYYTNYSIKTHPEEVGEEVTTALTKKDEYFEGYPWKFYSESWHCGDSCKWYNHNEDMLKISKQFSDVIIELHGEGEESGDYWYKYYKNGKLIKEKRPDLNLSEDMSTM